MEMTNEIEAKYYCECCNYKCIYPAHWKQHIDSEKHKIMEKEKREVIRYKHYTNF